MANFKRGAAAAEEAAKKNQGGNFARLRYFSLADGEQGVYRFLTDGDEWISVKQHTSVPTKNGPADAKKWPKSLPGVCRYDEAFSGIYHDCYVCDKPIMNPRNPEKPIGQALRVYAFAVVRNEVAPGQYEDDEVEVTRTVDGKEVTTTEKNIVVVNMGMKNFFAALSGIYGLTGTLRQTDFVIKRIGEGLETNYVIMGLPNSEVLSAYEWEGRYGEALKAQNLDLEEIVKDKASDDFYRKYFDDRYTVAANVPAQGGAPDAEQTATPDNEPTADALEEMRAKVRGYSAT